MATPSLPTGEQEPKPGEGPSPEEQEAGYFDMIFGGKASDGQKMCVTVTGDRDPGYGATSRMISECALLLAKAPLSTSGGIWTPASCMGAALIEALSARAGMTFTIE